MSSKGDKTKTLITGIGGIFGTYWISGLLHENLISGEFENVSTGQSDKFQARSGLILFPAIFTWFAGSLINTKIKYRTQIPTQNSLLCAIIIFISTLTYTIAAAKTSFPVVIAFKSSNVLSVLLVAILCTRVRDQQLTLKSNRIILGLIIATGVFLFGFFDPQINQRSANSQTIGIGLLIISLIADGFLPDFQAEIKSKYKPQPTQMMAQINKYLGIVSLCYSIVFCQFWETLSYMMYHHIFTLTLVGMSVITIFGEIFIYNLIKEFKQHIVPFVITIRKIFTILINMGFYGHQASPLQFLGMAMVVIAVIYEFSREIYEEKPKRRVESVYQPELFPISESILSTKY